MHNNNKILCSFRSTFTVSTMALALCISLARAVKSAEPIKIGLLISDSGTFAVASEATPLLPWLSGGRYVRGL
ncbi:MULTISPECIES: hypothetical protein [Pseudomonas]|uniref:hypothetical protein n=1 Tax=Pseudomonas TaxID=286 RepID=UPI00046560CD|nr:MULTISPECIES: hypothetical protein [Pseudomonas]TEK52007.1 hypothetical protein IPC589_25565 [Pseudomonas aeruginosa]TEK52239.1 hypothetical protein IPC582_23230 [Pseudomonas aeruginosa]TEK69116.1 hypothetical protein IPC584_10520 [Pseudomonas aeruginosa]TEK78451.1 hypothetical protein IPC578_10370 [Pseudomonas aeruginosa]TEK89025.1 hypothetical protein IPC580_05555 [Pseudomonas aeruginosa]